MDTKSAPGRVPPPRVSVEDVVITATQTGYIKLGDFSETSADELGRALKDLSAKGMKRLLLDIRDPANPVRIDAVSDSNFSYWHSATFNNDGTKLLFSVSSYSSESSDASFHQNISRRMNVSFVLRAQNKAGEAGRRPFGSPQFVGGCSQQER